MSFEQSFPRPEVSPRMRPMGPPPLRPLDPASGIASVFGERLRKRIHGGDPTQKYLIGNQGQTFTPRDTPQVAVAMPRDKVRAETSDRALKYVVQTIGRYILQTASAHAQIKVGTKFGEDLGVELIVDKNAKPPTYRLFCNMRDFASQFAVYHRVFIRMIARVLGVDEGAVRVELKNC